MTSEQASQRLHACKSQARGTHPGNQSPRALLIETEDTGDLSVVKMGPIQLGGTGPGPTPRQCIGRQVLVTVGEHSGTARRSYDAQLRAITRGIETLTA